MLDPGLERRSLSGHCEVGARLAARLGMDATVCDGLEHAYERWDGKGLPGGLAGPDVPVAVRVVTVARDAELWTRREGWRAAADVLADRRGTRTTRRWSMRSWSAGRSGSPSSATTRGSAVLDAEPAPVLTVGDTEPRRRARRRGRLRRPEVVVPPRALARRRPARGRGRRGGGHDSRTTSWRSVGRGSCTTSAASASRAGSGTTPARSPPSSGSGYASTATSASASSPAPRSSPPSPTSPGATTSAPTARATTEASRATGSRSARACSRRPMRTTR